MVESLNGLGVCLVENVNNVKSVRNVESVNNVHNDNNVDFVKHARKVVTRERLNVDKWLNWQIGKRSWVIGYR